VTKAKGSFELASWQEDTYEDLGDGAKLTRASVTQTFGGDIDGEGAVEWLMAYRPDGTAHFVGLHRIRGAIGGHKGMCVLETTGEFDGQMASWTATVVSGSGTAELVGLTGKGKFAAPRGPKATFDLDYKLT
jgi:hypothetical protein